MSNPYGTWSTPSARPSAGNPWKQNAHAQEVFRGLDYLYEVVASLTAPDNADGVLLATVIIQALERDAAVKWPSSVETAADSNALRSIFVDLDDPLQMWDLQAFLQQMQRTSWHDSLGDPPVHGAMWIVEAGTKLVWWNRETGAAYLTITAAASGIIDDASPGLTGLAFLDGRIYLSGTGGADVTILDLLGDGARRYSTGGVEAYGGTLGDFTGTAGWVVYNAAAAQQIVNDTVNDIGATRDPELADEFGRPKHWWVAGTDSQLSLFNPSADAIYDSSIEAIPVSGVRLEADGTIAFKLKKTPGSTDYVGLKRNIFGVSADGWTADEFYRNNQTDASDLAWTNSAVFGPVTLGPPSWASEGSPQLWITSDEGIYIAHTHPSDNDGKGGLIRLHEDYASPYMKGDVTVCYPGHAVTDVSPAGIDLTNNSATAFSSGGPAGSYATGDGAADYLSLTGQASLNLSTADFEIRFFFRTDDASNPGAEEVIVQLDDGVITDKVKVSLNTSGQLVFDVTDDGDSTNDTVTSGADFADGNWHHVSAGRDSGTFYLRVDGVTVGSTAVSNAAGSIDPTELGWLATPAGGSFFGGDSGGLVLSGTAITLREIRAEKTRGDRRIASTIDTNDTISDNDVVAVATDPHGGYVAVMGADKVVQIWSADTICPVASDAYPGTTARDLALKSMPGDMGDRHLLMAGSDQIELVQADTRIVG